MSIRAVSVVNWKRAGTLMGLAKLGDPVADAMKAAAAAGLNTGSYDPFAELDQAGQNVADTGSPWDMIKKGADWVGGSNGPPQAPTQGGLPPNGAQAAAEAARRAAQAAGNGQRITNPTAQQYPVKSAFEQYKPAIIGIGSLALLLGGTYVLLRKRA